MRKQITIEVEEGIYSTLEYFAKCRGVTVEEGVRFIIGDYITPMTLSQQLPIQSDKEDDPLDVLYVMMEATGMVSCKRCSSKLTAEEIKKNHSVCFKCKPDLDKLYDSEPLSDEDKK